MKEKLLKEIERAYHSTTNSAKRLLWQTTIIQLKMKNQLIMDGTIIS